MKIRSTVLEFLQAQGQADAFLQLLIMNPPKNHENPQDSWP
jgi:hypothetical protein